MTKEESTVQTPRKANPEATVNDKQVVFRSRFPVKDNARLGKLLTAAADGDTEKQIALLRYVVEKWDYDGAPDVRRSYDELDVIDDIIPMVNAFGAFILERNEAGQKN